MVSGKDNSWFTYYPNGPYSSSVSLLYYNDNKIYALAGPFGGNYHYFFEDNSWNNFNIRSMISIVKNPVNNFLYMGSYGYGLYEQPPELAPNYFNLYNDKNSPLYNIIPPGPNVRITGLAVDNRGDLWVSNWGPTINTIPSIHVKKTDGSWESFTFTTLKFGLDFDWAVRYPYDIVIDDNDYKWVRLDPKNKGGILVFKDTVTYIYLTDQTGKGGLPNQNVNCITKDKNGDIWVGTDEGVAVFYNPSAVFTDEDFNASTPIFDQRPLLETEQITTIAVDGGNRKWIGSRNGLWLFDDGATEEIINFTVDNSPLLSNNIIDIAIHGETGEVFIGTDKGIISFRGTSTESKSVHNNVEVFPNPVEPDFYGWVGIKGLATDAIVKITDVSGKLVYETQAEGGLAVWNVNDYNGDRVKAGIYLIFSTTKDEEDSYVAKIAVKD